ncbi:GH92 family glycosyl hydrolase [Burkholderia sp. Ax-1724]|uniref:GH92 family glycosyl hydrolase n=1 Tax=Burkholderia sp. Ax-1724 TaxID=2608336 RepID=UPI00142173F6|nr:GH92 family glycosyl hydrolase [Burkholderia sp. Ax-1724]NIF53041.1 glycoside hydrolase family 92 protein [Burkholderia sp. Ax-1724]
MLNKIRLGAVGTLTTLILAGCGGSTNNTAPSSPSSPQGGSPTSPGGSTTTPPSGGSTTPPVAQSLTQYVNPLIGTAPGTSPTPTAHGAGGNTLPAAGLPSGMVQWGPDTNTTPASSSTAEPGSPSGYYYDLNSIAGFSLTHMSGTGGQGNDGEIPFVATTSLANLTPTFSHANETAKPGYYAVALDNSVKVELTATLRTGFGRFTFPANNPAFIHIDTTRTNTLQSTTGQITQISSTEVAGYTVGGNFESSSSRVPVYFYAEFSQPIQSSTVSAGVADLSFAPGAQVLVKVGISYVSMANAKQNLDTENAGWDFDGIKNAADTAWNQRLSTIAITPSSSDSMTNFYTALYHALWAPSIFSDTNGQYLGFDGTVHTVANGQNAQYTGFSNWDVYRSQMPLRAMLFPTETSDMVQSLLNDADQCGAIPRWVNDNYDSGTMVGDGGTNIVATAYAFGAQKFDTTGALNHIMAQLNTNNLAVCKNSGGSTIGVNGGRSTYLKFGYITSGESAIASSSLEYNQTDFAASQFAAALGNTWMAKQALGRSAGWQYSIDTADTPPLLTARTTGGAYTNETQSSTDNYEQGSAEQYTWMVPWNLSGLVSLLGGNSTVQTRLDTMQTQLNAGNGSPYLYIGNEPSFAIPWVYNWAGAPSKTSDLIQKIVTTQFAATPGGLPGNDDMGAMSSWYVWAMIGMYPEVPGVAGFALHSPQVAAATITLENGKQIKITAPGAPNSNYVQSLMVNGKAANAPWLSFADVSNGGSLAYSMGSSASSWGTDPSNPPPSFGLPEYTSLADAFNNQGFSLDGSSATAGTGAAFDGSLNSLSTTALAAAIGSSGSVTTLGATFSLPVNLTQNQQSLDNVVVAGQTIDMPAGSKGSSLVFLGASGNGPSTGTVTVYYTDGTSLSASLTLDDGTLNGGGGTLTNTAAVTMTYRNNASGARDNTKSYLFSQAIAIDPTKIVQSVTLPANVSAGKMHVFGISVAG